MNKTAYILAGILLLVVGAGVVFYILKKQEIDKLKTLQKQGVFDDAEKIQGGVEGVMDLVKGFFGKKSM